jgi:hypothetical protein
MVPADEEFPREAGWFGFSIVSRREGLVTTANLLQRSPSADIATGSRTDAGSPDDVPSLASALRRLLADARTGRVRATAPGDRWLALRIEEALRAFEDIRQMAIGDESAPPMRADGTTGTLSILAPRVQAQDNSSGSLSGLPDLRYIDERKGEVT